MTNAPDPIAPVPIAPAPIAYATPTVLSNDAQHLKLLAIFHWVMGGFVALFACIGLIYVALGIASVSGAFSQKGPDEFPPMMGWMFIAMGGLILIVGWLLAALNIYCGFAIKNRKRWIFTIVISGIDCMWFPFGTILGVFTIIVLSRDSVKRLYAEQSNHVVA